MANPYDVVSRPDGLGTHENDLSYEGQPLSVADNVVVNRDGMIERRRGFKDFSSNLPDAHPEQLFAGSNGTDRYLHLDNGLWYYDTASSTWLRKRGSLGSKLSSPYGVAVYQGVLYVASAEDHVVYSINLSTGARQIVAGRVRVSGSTNGTGDAARFNNPLSIWSDGAGTLYVGDTGNTSVRAVTTAGVVTTVVGSVGAVNGIWGTGSDLYITDATNHIIRRVTGGIATTIAGTSGASGTTDATGSSARFNTPRGIWGDGAGNLYVADSGNHSIRQVTYPGAVVTTFAGLSGPANSGTTDGTGTSARFFSPSGVMIDSSGALIVVDTGNNRLRRATIPGAVVSTIVGSSSGFVDGIGTAARLGNPRYIAQNGATFLIGDILNNAIRLIYTETLYTTTIAGVGGYNPTVPGSSLSADGILVGPT